MEKIVKCHSCNKPILADDFGGIFTIKGLKGHFLIHNNKECLKKFMNFRRFEESKIKERAKYPWKYGCGHESTGIILDDNELSIATYLSWKDSVGIDGDISMCFDCYCKKLNSQTKPKTK